MKVELIDASGASQAAEDRRDPAWRILGHVVQLNGVNAVLLSRHVHGAPGGHWSVGHLITIVHGESRLVGVVCELNAAGADWEVEGSNAVMVRVELAGEIVDESPGKPKFFRGISSYPALGAYAHRIRSGDLRAIYSFGSEEGTEIGRLSQNDTIPAAISIKQLISRHFAVIGSTGVGKSTAVSMLIAKSIAKRPTLRVLLIDPHNEYKNFFFENSCLLDADNLELPYWMFRFEEIVDIVYGARKPSSDEIDGLHDAIRIAKAKFALAQSSLQAPSGVRRAASPDASGFSADTPVPYRMTDVILVLDEWMGKLEQRFARTDLRSLKTRLESLNKDPRYRFMFGKFGSEDNMAAIIGKIFRIPLDGAPVTIMQMAGLPNEVVNSVVSVLARLAFDVAVWSGGNFEVALVCEEAHRYIPNNSALGFAPTRLAIGRIAKEGRKYGASLGVITQRPSELDSTVLSQCSTMFAMRLPNEADKAIIRSALSESSASTISFLSSLANRECIAFGEAIPSPMRMKFGYIEWRADPAAAEAAKGETREIDRFDLRRIIGKLRGESSVETA